jgi:hypothetical protein
MLLEYIIEDPKLLLVLLLLLSVFLIFKGIDSLKNKKMAYPTGRRAGNIYRNVVYEGISSIAPSIAYIFFGSIIPLLLIGIFLQYYLDIPYAILLVFIIGIIIALLSIFYFHSRHKK